MRRVSMPWVVIPLGLALVVLVASSFPGTRGIAAGITLLAMWAGSEALGDIVRTRYPQIPAWFKSIGPTAAGLVLGLGCVLLLAAVLFGNEYYNVLVAGRAHGDIF